MLHYKNVREAYTICDAIGSEVRMEILEQILAHKEINLDSLAKNLHLTNGALTSHIKKLESVGIIKVSTSSGKRGSQKQCSICVDKLLIDIASTLDTVDSYNFNIDIGQYSDYSVSPYCGLASYDGFIGERDDPRYFSYPSHVNAAAIWFRAGHLTYTLPNAIKPKQKLKEIQISLELTSKAAGFNSDHPSNIHFLINNIEIGWWTALGEFNDRRGMLTPLWYSDELCQYGRYKMLTINKLGSFIDGLKLSDMTINNIKMNTSENARNTFTISAPTATNTSGGLILFGSRFGDYNSGIKYTVLYE